MEKEKEKEADCEEEYITEEISEEETDNYNNYNKKHNWTREDLEELYSMSYQNYTINEMSKQLNRPHKSILRALRRIQSQQAMNHDIYDVAMAHNMDIEKLTKRLKDPLYYIPIKTSEFPHIITVTSIVFGLVSLYGYLFYTP